MSHRIHIIDSHTGGEPTRVVIEGGPDLGAGPMTARVERFRNEFGGDVARQAEINRLTGLIDLLARGSGQAILLEGEPGIGKSSLARAAMMAAEERGFGSYWAE